VVRPSFLYGPTLTTVVPINAVITIAIRLRYDYDPTTTYRMRDDAPASIRREQKMGMPIFRRSRVVVVSQSNRNRNPITDRLVSTSSYLCHDVAMVVVSQRTSELIVGHVWSILPGSPESSKRFWPDDTELSVSAIPDDHLVVVVGRAAPEFRCFVADDVVVTVTEEFQQELP